MNYFREKAMGKLKVADIGTHFCSTVAKIHLNNQTFVGSW